MLLQTQVLLKTDKSTSTNSVKKQKNAFPVVQAGSQETERVVAVGDMDVLGQWFGQSILARVVADFGKV